MSIFTFKNIFSDVALSGLTESVLPPLVLNMSITGSVVILFVLLARLVLKKAPKVFSYVLWSVVLFRLLCPVSITTDFSLLGLFDTPAVENTKHTTAVEYIPYDVVHTQDLEVQLPVPPAINEAVNEALPHEHAALGADPLEGEFAIGSMIWLLGIGTMVIYSTVSYILLRRKLIGAVSLQDNIYLADGIDSPFVMGIIRPKIYLPSTLSEQEQGYILLHEQHHIRRGDHIIKVLAFVALCIHWFNPLVWVAFVLSSKDMEMSCDEAVVKKMGDGIRADYSASLLSLATGRRIIAGTPLAFGEGDTKSRIKNMLSWKRAKPMVVFLSAVAVIFALIICGTNAAKNDSWIKASPGATSVELECNFATPIRSYAIYEDIYENGELISSQAILFDLFQDGGGATPRQTSFTLNAQLVNGENGGFAGEIALSSWSAHQTRKLPKEHYTGVAHIAGEIGDGIRKKQKVATEDNITLITILLSTEPDGTVVVETRDNSLIESNDTVVIYRLVTSEDGIEQYFSNGDTTTSENITGNRGDQSVEHVPFVGTMELLGKWVLDGAYTENANSGLSLRSLFGSALGDYGASLQLSADGSIEYYIGVLTGKGTWHADGDTGRYIAELVVHPDERNETLIFHGFRESPDSKHYLVLNYGEYALYWTQSDTDSSHVAVSDLAEDIAYHLELAAGDDFRDMTSEKLAEIMAEYNDLLDDYSLIARESTDGKAVYIVGQFNGDPTQSPLYGMYGIELSAGEEEVFQFLYREEQSETVEAVLAANKTDFPPSAGYRIEDSRILWSSNGGTVLIQPKDAELLMDVPYNRYLHTPNGREYIADAVSRGIDVCGRTDTFLYVYLISERFGEIAERIALTKEEALAIQAEERVRIIDGFGFSASLHIDGQTIYYNEREGIPQTVLDLAVERCDYRFGDPGMITDTIREARLDCDWLETPLYAKTEDLPRLREILKNAEFGYVGSCGYGAKLSLTFTGGEKLTVFKGTDGCDTIVFGSYGGYFLGDKENTEFWEIFGLDPESKLPQERTEER